VELEWKSQSTL